MNCRVRIAELLGSAVNAKSLPLVAKILDQPLLHCQAAKSVIANLKHKSFKFDEITLGECIYKVIDVSNT